MNIVFTGSYNYCKQGNLISISGDKDRSANFNGKYIKKLAHKLNFWNIWHKNIRIRRRKHKILY